MSNSCPLNFEKVDSNVSRLNSLFVASLVILYLLSSSIYILMFLAVDFIIKLFVDKKFSPILVLARFIKGMFRMKDKFTDGGAKRLATMFGLLFVFLLIITHLLSAWLASSVIAAIFLSCALLDVFFDYCIGCKVYFIIKKIYPSFMNHP